MAVDSSAAGTLDYFAAFGWVFLNSPCLSCLDLASEAALSVAAFF
jgi:hypothetical protein